MPRIPVKSTEKLAFAEERGKLKAKQQALKKEGVLIIAIETGKDTISYIDYIPPTFPICLIFGNEITGISQDILALADKKISIPIYGIKESLNVSVAGGVILYNMLEKYLHTTDIKRNTLQ